MSILAPERDGPLGSGLRWAVAGVLVIGLHLEVGWLVVGRAMLPREPETAVPGIAIDLDPVAVPQDQTAPAPAPPAGIPDAAETLRDPPPPAAAESDPAPAPPVEPQPAPEPAPAVPEPSLPASDPPSPSAVEPVPQLVPLPPPDLPKVPGNDAVLTPPPRPVARPRQAASRKIDTRKAIGPRASDRRPESEERRAKHESRAVRQRTDDGATPADLRFQQGAQEQERASASAGAVASWRSQLAAHLERFKRAPAEGGAGTARVSFTVDRNGSVIGVRLAASSGNSALDEAALAMVEHANPVPAPPSAIGNRISVSLPVHFSGS